MSIYFPPVQIDPAGLGDQSNGNFFGASQTEGPWLANGALYVILMPQFQFGNVLSIDAWKSTDSGQTWTEMDHAHAPQGGQMVACFDGAHTMTACFTTTNASAPTPVNLMSFDCLTDTWGPLSVQSVFTLVDAPGVLFSLATGGFLLVYPTDGILLDVAGAFFNAGVWGAQFAIDTNALAAMTGNKGTYLGTFGVSDPAGSTHLFFGYNDGVFVEHLFYQLVTSAGVLGSFFEFGAIPTPLTGQYGTPCLQGTNLVFPVQTVDGSGNNRTSIYVGVGLTAPAWTLFSDIDPGMVGSASFLSNLGCAAAIGGQVLVIAAWPVAGYPNGLLRLSTTSDFIHWVFSSITAYDVSVDGPPAFQIGGGQDILSPAITPQGLAVEAFNLTDTSFARFFFQPLAPPPPPPPLFSEPISGGGPPAILCPRPINLYDLCAEDEVRRTKGIHFPKACNIPECLLPWDEDYQPVPAGGVPFNIFGTIETPAAIAGDVLVCSGRVPHGYDGLLTEIYQIYQGSGFQQGSGDIVWRIRRNQIWLKTLGNMPYSLGTPKSPVWLTQGEIMFSGTQFFFFVNVPNLSSMIQVGASTISCGMRGFYWPRG